jgi:transcriptional regulator with XRE-family HTH domain
MQEFKNYLQQELLRRKAKNPSYSLRSFALQLKLNHATLSSLIAGKRKLTPYTVKKLAKALNLGPEDLSRYTGTAHLGSENSSYFVIAGFPRFVPLDFLNTVPLLNA